MKLQLNIVGGGWLLHSFDLMFHINNLGALKNFRFSVVNEWIFGQPSRLNTRFEK